MYTLHQDLTHLGEAVVGLRNDDPMASEIYVHAPCDAAGDVDAAWQALADRIVNNLVADWSTKFRIDLTQIPEPFATVLRNRLELRRLADPKNIKTWQNALTSLESARKGIEPQNRE